MMTVVNEIDFDKHCLMSFEEMIEAIARVADKLTDKKNQTQNAPKNSENQKIDYDPLKREPRFSKADKCPMFEICILANHSHPTVKLWAEKILKG